jgi:uncharacterized protein (TIGR03084 family)
MDDAVDALEAQQGQLTGLLEGLDDAGWSTPSPCEGWDVADVVLHLVQTNLMAVASLDDALDAFYERQLSGARIATDVDDGAAAMVEQERGDPPAVLLERWRSGAADLTARLRAHDPSARVPWVAGTLSARTLATTRLSETWIHTGDVAAAVHVDLAPTPALREIARLAWRTLPYAFGKAGRELSGPVAFELVGPDGEPWTFTPEGPAATTVRGPGLDLCNVAGRRAAPADTALVAEGPDADAVLELVRTYA